MNWRAQLFIPAYLSAQIAGVPDLRDPPPALAQQKTIVREMVDAALSLVSEVPDFICTELITREEASRTPKFLWRIRDTLVEEVRYAAGEPDLKLVKIDGKRTQLKLRDLGGISQDSLLAWALFPNRFLGGEAKTSFNWSQWALGSGGRMYVFSFRTGAAFPQAPRIANAFNVRYHGLISIDEMTGGLRRLNVHVDSPSDFPFKNDEWVINYGPVVIAGQEWMLPVDAVLHVTQGDHLYRNTLKFTSYKKYTSASTIEFGDRETDGRDDSRDSGGVRP